MLPTDEETWRDVPGATGYEVSNQGKVRSWKWPGKNTNRAWVVRKELGFKVLKQDIRGDMGYAYVNIAYDIIGLRKKNVNVLVLEAFVGERPDGCQAAHNDGNPLNNNLNNLRWSTPKDNNKDKIKHGTHQSGHLIGTSVLNLQQIKEIRLARKKGVKNIDLANKYNVCRNTITNITTKRTYTNVAS